MGAPPKRREELLTPLFLLGGGAFPLSPPPFGGAASPASFLWCFLPSAFFGWRGRFPFWNEIN